MDLSTITIADFKAKFYRDFTYNNQNQSPPNAPVPYDVVQDIDITNAFSDAQEVLNQCLFADGNGITIGYLLLTAHFLALAIKSSDSGINGGGGTFPVQSRSVGSVSESYMIPDAYKDSPVLSGYTSTSYGMRYLNMVLPYIIGNVVPVVGGVQPNSDITNNNGLWQGGVIWGG